MLYAFCYLLTTKEELHELKKNIQDVPIGPAVRNG